MEEPIGLLFQVADALLRRVEPVERREGDVLVDVALAFEVSDPPGHHGRVFGVCVESCDDGGRVHGVSSPWARGSVACPPRSGLSPF